MPAAKLRATELRLIDDLFDMGGGYVLDFSNQTFAEFFADELGVLGPNRRKSALVSVDTRCCSEFVGG